MLSYMHSNNSNSTLTSSCWKVFLIYARCMIYLSCFIYFFKQLVKPTDYQSAFGLEIIIVSKFYWDISKAVSYHPVSWYEKIFFFFVFPRNYLSTKPIFTKFYTRTNYLWQCIMLAISSSYLISGWEK